MEKRNNLYEIKGVVYEKPVKTVLATKGDNRGKNVDIPSIVLEVRGNGNGKEYIELIEFAIGNRSIDLNDFYVKDSVEITFALGGVKGTKGYFTRAKAIYIKHADVQYNDTRDLRATPPKREKDVFTGAVPETIDSEDDNDLPF